MSDKIIRANFALPDEPEIFTPKPIAKPYRYRPSSEIPPRPWQLARLFLRRYLTVTAAPGGVGKTSEAMLLALVIALNKPLLGVKPIESGPVLIFNGEDPEEEVEMRLAAIVEAHGSKHGFSGHDLEGRVFLQSGRGEGNDWVVIRQAREGLAIVEPKVEAIRQFIIDNGIVHVVVDPFISTHEVNENDNPAINAAATLWVNIAHEANCSVHLVHHARKTNGTEVTEESARGAKALTDKARITRFLQHMTEEEARDYGLDPNDRFAYVRANEGKVNLHQRTGSAEWLRLIGVELGNGECVQTCIPWKPPNAMQGVTVEHLAEVQAKVQSAYENDTPLRTSPQSKEYAARVVAETLGLAWENKADKRRAKVVFDRWMREGALETVRWMDKRQGREAPVVVVGSQVELGLS